LTGVQLVYTLAWTRQDGRPLPARIVDDGMGTLTIRAAQPDDEGTYVCTGSDFSYNVDTDTATLTVRGITRWSLGGGGPYQILGPRLSSGRNVRSRGKVLRRSADGARRSRGEKKEKKSEEISAVKRTTAPNYRSGWTNNNSNNNSNGNSNKTRLQTDNSHVGAP